MRRGLAREDLAKYVNPRELDGFPDLLIEEAMAQAEAQVDTSTQRGVWQACGLVADILRQARGTT